MYIASIANFNTVVSGKSAWLGIKTKAILAAVVNRNVRCQMRTDRRMDGFPALYSRYDFNHAVRNFIAMLLFIN